MEYLVNPQNINIVTPDCIGYCDGKCGTHIECTPNEGTLPTPCDKKDCNYGPCIGKFCIAPGMQPQSVTNNF